MLWSGAFLISTANRMNVSRETFCLFYEKDVAAGLELAATFFMSVICQYGFQLRCQEFLAAAFGAFEGQGMVSGNAAGKCLLDDLLRHFSVKDKGHFLAMIGDDADHEDVHFVFPIGVNGHNIPSDGLGQFSIFLFVFADYFADANFGISHGVFLVVHASDFCDGHAIAVQECVPHLSVKAVHVIDAGNFRQVFGSVTV